MAIIPYGNTTVTDTLYATVGTSWTSNSGGYYTQTVSVPGILATDNPIIDVVTTTSGYNDEEIAWGMVFKVTTADNAITLYATEATATSVNIQLKVVR